MTTPVPKVSAAPIRGFEPWLVAAVVALVYLPFLGSYGLWDPWEGHYAEVARRMLAEDDALRMRWMHENFFSKPPLTFWLMAASMTLFGVATDGGFSGELVSGPLVEFAVRLPFALMAIIALAFLWGAIARLHSRRTAWLAVAITGTSPYYFFIARQAITDMPMCALLVISSALFLLTVFEDPARPMASWRVGRFRVTALHVFLAVFAVVAVGQLAVFTDDLWRSRIRLAGRRFMPAPLAMVPFLLFFGATAWWCHKSTRTAGQVRMYWFYLLAGLSVLAKGPLAPGLLGLTIFCFIALTGRWALLKRVEIPRGLLVALLVGLPWHFAMYGKDGNAWAREYLNQHLLARAFQGVHGDRGSFLYFVEELGIGMWPWVAFLPVALGALVVTLHGRSVRDLTSRDQLKLYFGIWAIVGFFFFSIVETKFHHYILPAVPALGTVVALWLGDVTQGRVAAARGLLVLVLGVFLLVSLDVVPRQEELVRLFIYRYDRTIPRQAPWNLDFTGFLAVFAALFALVLLASVWSRGRRLAPWGCVGIAVAFTYFCLDVLMIRATPHFSQRGQHEYYYRHRDIRGVELEYGAVQELRRDLSRPLEVATVIPFGLEVGAPAQVSWKVGPDEGVLTGRVSRIDTSGDRFFIEVPSAELARLPQSGGSGHARRIRVDGDPLIATLYWRAEGFYSGGQLYEPGFPDRQTAFHEFNDKDKKKLRAYIDRHKGDGRRFWLITEVGRIARFKNELPSDAQQSFTRSEETSTFFGTASWRM